MAAAILRDELEAGDAVRLLVAMTRQTWRKWALSLSVNRGSPRLQQCPTYQFGYQRTLAYSCAQRKNIFDFTSQ
jgi:hypothetical protein